MKAQRLVIATVLLLIPSAVLAQGIDGARLDRVLGRSAQKTGEVLKYGFPRTDLHVTVEGVTIRPGLALGSWAAFSGTESDASVMGDLVLLEGEVNPVVAKLRSSGFEITAIHNHLMNENPPLRYVHYMGHGDAEQLARSLRSALAESKTPLGTPARPAPSTPAAAPAFVKTIDSTLGTSGHWAGGVLSFGIPRAEAITEAGMTLSPAQGVAESINFQSAGEGRVATTGDFVLTAQEVGPVISALEEHHIQITALHNHMLTEQPRLFFMHFWAVGQPAAVAQGIRAALGQIHTK